ncbi:hypothetical protein NM208_g11509 [Fusarium decemcellulare]|uniref:Uncharacterized protein n=1 Tax=Fusarium decemcellulare TaxID=57161 RepID=A0ACC1RUN2_9HYPO|nr:hypothetical protein NM208_g11509 [Fusarium decemcellulare]
MKESKLKDTPVEVRNGTQKGAPKRERQLLAQLRQCEANLQALQQEKEEISAQLEDMKTEQQANFLIKKRLDSLEAHQDELEEQLADSKNDTERLEHGLTKVKNSLKRHKEKSEAECSELRKRVKKLKTDRGWMEQQLDDLQDKMGHLASKAEPTTEDKNPDKTDL